MFYDLSSEPTTELRPAPTGFMRRFVTHPGYCQLRRVILNRVATTWSFSAGCGMTVQELDQKLSEPGVFEKFRGYVGGDGGNTKDWYLNHFLAHPEVEAKWAAHFKLPTEDARKTKAALDSAVATKDSARHAEEANRIAVEANRIAASANSKAGWSLGVSVFAALVSLVALVVTWIKK